MSGFHYSSPKARNRLWVSRFVVVMSAVLLALSAHAEIRLESGLVLDLSVEPGLRYEGTLQLRNVGTVDEIVSLYLGDYSFDASGFAHPEAGTLPRSNTGWIDIGQDEILVPAGQVVTHEYVIQVPADPSLEGTFWGMLYVEPRTAVAVEDAAEGNEEVVGLALDTVSRFGVQVATTIAGTGSVELAFANPALAAGESTRLVVELHNLGDRGTLANVTFQLIDQAGLVVAAVEDGEPLRLYPDTSVTLPVDLGQLASGEYQAIYIADTEEDVFGARYTLEIE